MEPQFNAPKPSAPKKTRNLMLVGVGCGVASLFGMAILGILAAIAIPAFLKASKRSKAAEAEYTMQMLETNADIAWSMDCAFPPPLAKTGSVESSCGGEKYMPTISDPDALGDASLGDSPLYFVYSTRTEKTADGEVYIITAQADLNCGGPVYTIEQRVVGKKDDMDMCTVESMPPVTVNDFQ